MQTSKNSGIFFNKHKESAALLPGGSGMEVLQSRCYKSGSGCWFLRHSVFGSGFLSHKKSGDVTQTTIVLLDPRGTQRLYPWAGGMDIDPEKTMLIEKITD